MQNFSLTNARDPYKFDRCILVDPSDLIDFHATFENLGMALLV